MASVHLDNLTANNTEQLARALAMLVSLVRDRQEARRYGRLTLDLNFEDGKVKNWRMLEENISAPLR